MTISEDGKYKLNGSNCIDGAWVDVKIIAAKNTTVEIVCDAVIKNDCGYFGYASSSTIKYSSSNNDSLSDSECAYNYAVPFAAKTGATLTLSGKLAVDTYSIYCATCKNGSESERKEFHFTANYFETEGNGQVYLSGRKQQGN